MKKSTVTITQIITIIMIVLAGISANLWGASVTVQTTGDNTQPAVLNDLNVQINADPNQQAVFSNPSAHIQWLNTTGQPDMPWVVMDVLLGPDADPCNVTGLINQYNYETLDGNWKVKPVGPMATCDENGQQEIIWPANKNIIDGRDVDIYGRDAYWPTLKVRVLTTGNLRNWHLAEIAIPMVRYNPVQGKLQKLSTMNVSVDYMRMARPLGNSSQANTQTMRVDADGQQRVEQLAVNYDQAVSQYDSVGAQQGQIQPAGDNIQPAGGEGYVIITSNAIKNASQKLNDFVTHKQQMGYTVHVITEDQMGDYTGDAAANHVRSWLQAHYQDTAYGTNGIKYVLIIEDPRTDRGHAPMKMCISDHPTDYYYAELTANWDANGNGVFGESGEDDKYFEVYTGRIPYYGNINDTDHILQKTIDYENATNIDWRRNALLPMVPLDASTPSYQLGEQIKYNILEPQGITSVRIYDKNYGCTPPPEYLRSQAYPATIWSQGKYGLIVWDTHGWSGGASGVISTGNVANLDDDHCGTVWQGSCDNAWPESTNNLAYAILKHGGIGTIGATRHGWYYIGQSNYTNSSTAAGLGYQYAKRIVQQQSDGEALYNSKEAVSFWRKNYYVYNLYGDPSVVVLGPQPALTITPGNGLLSYGIEGGPFEPGYIDYTLHNNSQQTLDWTAYTSENWLTANETSGTIAAGETKVVRVYFNTKAQDLGNGIYKAYVAFTDTTHSKVLRRYVKLHNDTLEGYWKFDAGRGSQVSDFSGHGHLAALKHTSEQSWGTDGIASGALQFDGVDDYVEITGYKGILGSAPRTCSAWIKTTQQTGTIMAWGNAADNEKWMFMVKDGVLRVGTWAGPEIKGSIPVADGQWHYVVAALADDGSPNVKEVKLYVDGQKDTHTTNTAGAIDTKSGTDVMIGAIDEHYGTYFKGCMDEVRIYNFALSQAQIDRLYRGGLAGYWPMNEHIGTTVVDYSIFGRNGTLKHMGQDAHVQGYQGQALYFDGTNDYIDVKNYKGITGGKSRTCMAWIKTTASSGTIMAWGDSNPGEKWMFMVYNNMLRVAVWGGGQVVGSTNIADGKWHYVAAVLEDDASANVSEVKLYVDGNEETLNDVSKRAIDTKAAADVTIGAIDSHYGNYFNGIIDQVQLYDYAFSASGIQRVYNHGLQGCWKFDEDSGTEAADASVYAHTGTLKHMTDANWQKGVTGNALSFNGINNYVDVPGFKGIAGGASRSCSAWIKTTASEGTIMSWGDSSPGKKWMFMVHQNVLRVAVWGGGQIMGSTNIADGKWHYVAAVLEDDGASDVSKIRLYVDTKPETISNVTPETINTAGNTIVRIGVIDSHYGNYFNGLIDDVRIYDYALGRAELERICTSDSVLSKWLFNETGGTETLDSANYHHNGTMVNMTDNNRVQGLQGRALQFNGKNDYVEIDNYKGITGSHARSCGAWIKTTRTEGTIVSWGKSKVVGGKWMFMVHQGVLRVAVWGGGQVMGSTNIADGKWHYVAAVLEDSGPADVSNVKLYVDGKLEHISFSTAQTVNTLADSNVIIGAIDTTYGNYFNGTIDEVCIVNYAMTQPEIASLIKFPGDFNHDGQVDIVDLVMFSNNWLKTGQAGTDISACDLDSDGEINLFDFEQLSEFWLRAVK